MRSLPDHLLADIGVQRDQIPGLVNGMMARQSTWQDAPAKSATRPFASLSATLSDAPGNNRSR